MSCPLKQDIFQKAYDELTREKQVAKKCKGLFRVGS